MKGADCRMPISCRPRPVAHLPRLALTPAHQPTPHPPQGFGPLTRMRSPPPQSSDLPARSQRRRRVAYQTPPPHHLAPSAPPTPPVPQSQRHHGTPHLLPRLAARRQIAPRHSQPRHTPRSCHASHVAPPAGPISRNLSPPAVRLPTTGVALADSCKVKLAAQSVNVA